ncbi:MAG: glycosyltransferase [Thermodesulfobacteriota bacterium]
MKKPLGIIIPVYNEGENIGTTIRAIEANIKTPHTIHIVYDFEEDDTLPPAMMIAKEGVDIVFIKNPVRGVVGAIKEGLGKAKGEYLLVTMADMSDDYTVVDRMCELMKDGFDVVCGSRYMPGGRQVGGPLIKKTISRIVGLSLKYLAGIPTHDATNSFKLYRRSMLGEMTVESDGGFEIGIEVVTKAHFSGYKVTELPCTWIDRDKGESRFKVIGWAPNYLKWYFYAFRHAFFKKKGRR